MMLKRFFCLLAAGGLVLTALAVPALAQESPVDSATGVGLKENVKSRLERLQVQRQEIEKKIKERGAQSPSQN